jgi:hypothetical protein
LKEGLETQVVMKSMTPDITKITENSGWIHVHYKDGSVIAHNKMMIYRIYFEEVKDAPST